MYPSGSGRSLQNSLRRFDPGHGLHAVVAQLEERDLAKVEARGFEPRLPLQRRVKLRQGNPRASELLNVSRRQHSSSPSARHAGGALTTCG